MHLIVFCVSFAMANKCVVQLDSKVDIPKGEPSDAAKKPLMSSNLRQLENGVENFVEIREFVHYSFALTCE